MDQEPQSIILFPTTEILASTHRMRRYIKLIDLYEKHECLWNQFSKDFFNFELRNKIWSEIAEQMKKNSSPDTWKCILHSLRYNVEIERLREQEASFYNMRVELAPKLVYAEKFKFLKRMYMGGHATMKVPFADQRWVMGKS
ncbi:uncharacterized protein LOC115628584 isoform X2 [Scaptodrosophila lebanonensis]|uniref:Uncharacterized protein LOC115628584 isoform X2 n=1 Tax=Drosophila lebanonensis TaxID=7225 RepID=A0A6J2TYF3_DROLE|nr:uncharacterized protein LOC115628584 isoform X2 [Scaptodrosophila lebanonensis]